MPTQPFSNMFMKWQDNENLPTEALRLKVVTLTGMLRPSDMAPQAVTISKGVKKNMQFSVNQIQFLENGDMKLKLFAIKNDYARDGFEISIVGSSVEKLCPVRALKCYVDRNGVGNQDSSRPVLTPLNFPLSALSAALIANILCKAITWAGLDGQGYTAKSFRPTGATVAIQNGMEDSGMLSETLYACETRKINIGSYFITNSLIRQ